MADRASLSVVDLGGASLLSLFVEGGFVFGMELLFAPWGLGFLVGFRFAGGGCGAGLLLSQDGGGASFSFTWCASGWWLLSLPFFLKDADQAAGVEDGGQLDLAPFSLDGGGRRCRAQVQELEGAGRGPGRWATADGSLYFDSCQSQCAMGLL
jgi:hypothetical protein